MTETVEKEGLLPCPFCDGLRGPPVPSSWPMGSAAELQTAEDVYGHQVRCICGAAGPDRTSEAEAVDAWNRRTAPRPPVGEELREKVARIVDPGIWATIDRSRSGEPFTPLRDDMAAGLLSPSLEKADAILSALQGEGEAVAWRWRYDAEHPWHYGSERPGKFRFGDPDEVQPLYASPALHPQEAACGGGWRDMDSAPRDRIILVGYDPEAGRKLAPGERVYEARWCSRQQTWTSRNGFILHSHATHWRELPAGPLPASGGGDE